ncbi:hypothetical protein Dhaf_2706 [Desulfitobacterium hafniense DCB-2]|uniref:Uncharacterized protein n=1 Tax=Desulfitobacterium hafniense (strain DSM 10664 / DCB-2) TaxID=272564 RepID=B8FWC0_DESHD|nr:hypothetical protein Dhaf_2706 [Desulfitobacterium hafniense DCB-2]
MQIVDVVISLVGTPPEGFEATAYKTACILLLVFYCFIFAVILQFQRAFRRRGKS